jgi:hypothetical protein
MTQPTKDELLKRLADARAEQEGCTAALIWLELDELQTALSAHEDQAAAKLRETVGALADPQAGLDAVDTEIASADAKRAGLAGQLDDDDDDADPDALALVRLRLQEWDRKLTRLRSKRDFAESGMQPLVEARDQSRKALADIQAAKKGLMWAMMNPFASPVAQATQAYIGCRQPYLNHVLLKNDRSDPEWETAVAELEECCLRSAYRTDNLPSEAQQAARAMTAAMADTTTSPPPPAPGMADIMKQTEAEMTNMALQKSPTKIDDYRNRPPVPRNARVEEYRQVPTLREMGLG